MKIRFIKNSTVTIINPTTNDEWSKQYYTNEELMVTDISYYHEHKYADIAMHNGLVLIGVSTNGFIEI